MKTEFLFNHNNFYPKYGTQLAFTYGNNTYESNQHVLFGEGRKKITLVTCITRIFKEIVAVIICFACFYNFVKHFNS